MNRKENTVDKMKKRDTSIRLEGIVVEKQRGSYQVCVADSIVPCILTPGQRALLCAGGQGAGNGNGQHVLDPVAVGDKVSFYLIEENKGLIEEIMPRKNVFSRRAAGKKHLQQVMVANVDQVVAVFAAAQPRPKWNLLDRYLVSAESAGIPAVICMTKMDLAGWEDLRPVLDEYRQIGYPVIETSVQNGSGLEQVRALFARNISVLIGKSGVGKTSLLNAVQPGLGQRVGAVSAATTKGKHTTTSLAMFDLENGGSLVDTPGIREFGLWEVDSRDLDEYFPEMRPYIGECHFGSDCRHDHERDCAVKKAVAAGAISAHRYQSYLKLSQ